MAVLSFAHLKKTKPEAKVLKVKNELLCRTTYRIPAVAMTAKLSAVNYCRGCDRFIRGDPGTPVKGGYGWCLRKGWLGGDEEWKPIPASATIEKCRYWIEITPQG